MASNYILISAATSDIGAAIANRLTHSNNLLLHGRDQGKLEALQKSISGKNDVKTWCADFKKADEIQTSLKEIMSKNVINVSGLVHCAATLKILPLKNFRLEYMREIFEVNFFSALEIIRTLLLMTNNGRLDRIVFISSIFSNLGSKGNTIYSASKGALDSLAKSMALELAPAVKVNSILPGGMRTKMTDHLFDDESYMTEYHRNYPLGEGNPANIASMTAYLLSDAGNWITGQQFIVDGGYSAR